MLTELSYLADFSIIKDFNLEPKSPEVRGIAKIFEKYPHVFKALQMGLAVGKKRMLEFEEVLRGE